MDSGPNACVPTAGSIRKEALGVDCGPFEAAEDSAAVVVHFLPKTSAIRDSVMRTGADPRFSVKFEQGAFVVDVIESMRHRWNRSAVPGSSSDSGAARGAKRAHKLPPMEQLRLMPAGERMHPGYSLADVSVRLRNVIGRQPQPQMAYEREAEDGLLAGAGASKRRRGPRRRRKPMQLLELEYTWEQVPWYQQALTHAQLQRIFSKMPAATASAKNAITRSQAHDAWQKTPIAVPALTPTSTPATSMA